MQKPRIKCESYKSWTDYGYEYDCGHGSGICCEDCVLCGGHYSPVTGKKFRGNAELYREGYEKRFGKINAKPIMIKLKAARKLKSTNKRFSGSRVTPVQPKCLAQK